MEKKQNASPVQFVDAAAGEQAEQGAIDGFLLDTKVVAPSNGLAQTLYDQQRFGEPSGKKIGYALVEALYLVEKERMTVKDGNKTIDFDTIIRKAKKQEPNFWIRYVVYRDMRNRGYIVKTALKFGADFRVYDRGVKPGEDHAKWIVYPVHEGSEFSWFEISAKNRVAHSTRKRLLIGVVDVEDDVTYFELKWTRP
ncbi:MAG TPA: tRNA-intron lyase [Candidatus Nanoarchaeia archaeon]|nr:tRNA-intron lyase [Candidatus Nanoarchaeia archaeon]